MEKVKIDSLAQKASEVRALTLKTIGGFGSGHIGGASSIAEIVTALYFDLARLDPKNPRWDDRDRIVLSKGHAGPVLYCALALRGYFDLALLETLNRPGTLLPSHCDMNKTPGVDMTAGSLGQGFSAAVGMAYAAKLGRKTSRVYCIVGDGESQEGQIWEAAMLAGAKKLDNLTVFLDYNKMQIDGTVEEICTMEPVGAKWRAFGFETLRINGHDVEAIDAAVRSAWEIKGRPTMIICDTVKGKGIKCCEGKVSSHSVVFTPEMLATEPLLKK